MNTKKKKKKKAGGNGSGNSGSGSGSGTWDCEVLRRALCDVVPNLDWAAVAQGLDRAGLELQGLPAATATGGGSGSGSGSGGEDGDVLYFETHSHSHSHGGGGGGRKRLVSTARAAAFIVGVFPTVGGETATVAFVFFLQKCVYLA
jgi:hypothetical protein